MHTWPPARAESREHLARLDQLFGEAAAAAPDAAFLLTADHGMNFKTRAGIWIRPAPGAARPFASPFRSSATSIPSTIAATAASPGSIAGTAARSIAWRKSSPRLPGVDAVLTRSEAARRFHLMPSRIGDLVVLGDKHTVFGDLDTESEALPPEYRSHGSMYERDVPLMIHNADAKLSPDDFRYNRDLARWLYPLRSSSL